MVYHVPKLTNHTSVSSVVAMVNNIHAYYVTSEHTSMSVCRLIEHKHRIFNLKETRHV